MHTKFGQNWPSTFKGNVDDRRWTDCERNNKFDPLDLYNFEVSKYLMLNGSALDIVVSEKKIFEV